MSDDEKEIVKQDFGPEENWNYNPVNGQPLKRGVHNFRNLFKKPSLTDWITLFIIIMALIGSYFYYADTKTCRETLGNLGTVCAAYFAQNQSEGNSQYSNLSNMTVSFFGNYSVKNSSANTSYNSNGKG